MTDEILAQIRSGELTPADGLDKALFTATHIKDISIADMQVEVLPSGWEKVDEYAIFKKKLGELIVIGARPSVGKSAFLFQLASHVARDGCVLAFSLEMNKESIKHRLIAMQSKRHIKQVQHGDIDEKEIEEANTQIGKLNLHIDDRCGITVNEIYATALAYHRRYRLNLIVVDYLQIIHTPTGRSRNEELAHVTKTLKELAKEIGAPVVAASQLNRQVEFRGKNPQYSGTEEDRFMPVMSDLRDSGCIEADADVIMFLNRHEVFDPEGCPPRLRDTAQIAIAKHRNGSTGVIHLAWLGSRTMFKDPLNTKEPKHGKETNQQKSYRKENHSEKSSSEEDGQQSSPIRVTPTQQVTPSPGLMDYPPVTIPNDLVEPDFL